jgi:hypothetical protein
MLSSKEKEEFVIVICRGCDDERIIAQYLHKCESGPIEAIDCSLEQSWMVTFES